MITQSPSHLRWSKSSHSDSQSGTCVEIAMWRKSSHSQQQASECVEVAKIHQRIAVRDSKDPDGPVLTLSLAQWRALRGQLRSGA